MSGWPVLLFDVLAQDRDRWAPADGAGEIGPGPQAARPPVVAAQAREFLPQPPRGHPFEAVDQPGDGDGGREVHQQVDMLGFPVELAEVCAEVRAYVPYDLLHPLQVSGTEYLVPVLGDENQMDMQEEDTVFASAYVPVLTHETNHALGVQCRPCRAWLDRDINAAVNVAKAAGLAVTACGAQVRPGLAPAQRGEAGTHPKSHRKAA